MEAERVKRKENTWERGMETGWRKVTSRNLMNKKNVRDTFNNLHRKVKSTDSRNLVVLIYCISTV